MNWNKMKRLFCTEKGKLTWANGTKPGTFRCTACGSTGHVGA